MTRQFDDLLENALKLPPEARAALAGSLIESLDGDGDEDVQAAWEAEITRRIRELDEGKVHAIPWAEVRRRLIRS